MPVAIRGQVLDPDAKPVAGAQILSGVPCHGTSGLVISSAPGDQWRGRSIPGCGYPARRSTLQGPRA